MTVTSTGLSVVCDSRGIRVSCACGGHAHICTDNLPAWPWLAVVFVLGVAVGLVVGVLA